jgi:hypothetical protein
MLPYHLIERYLLEYAQYTDLVMELRNLIAKIAPDAREEMHSYGLTYYHQGGGPVNAGICQIGLYPDHIRLGFIHGRFINDPQHLLEGTQKAKRYVRLRHYEDVPWEDIAGLIRESSAFDPYTMVPEEFLCN